MNSIIHGHWISRCTMEVTLTSMLTGKITIQVYSILKFQIVII